MYPWTLQSTININYSFLSANVCYQVPNLTCGSNCLTPSIILSTIIKKTHKYFHQKQRTNITSSRTAKIHKTAFKHLFSHQTIHSLNLSDSDYFWKARKGQKWVSFQQSSPAHDMSFILSYHRQPKTTGKTQATLWDHLLEHRYL